MKKNLIPVFVSFASLMAFSAHAEVSADLLKKYHWGDYSFDGNKVSNAVKGQMVNFDNKAKSVSAKGASGEYNMSWTTEDINDSQVLTLTESTVTPVGNDLSKVYARTSTFSKEKLRSSTFCFGSSLKGKVLAGQATVTENNMKCVTATRQSCKRLMESYAKEAGKPQTTVKSMQDVATATRYCSATIDSFKKMASAFGNQSAQIERIHGDIVKSDTARVKGFIDKATKSGNWDPTNVGASTTSSELDKMAEGYASSMNGMEVLSTALQVCASANGDFQEVATTSSSSSSGGGSTGSGSSSGATSGRQ